ncbi:hypothetical protein QQF64_008374 [Cirrhinus molitorella]|uniref:Uncharacterized protein n=1 Tax=Cirrhinus molitorella TaxID=172907 RepID=A0ABR3M9G0_9TELE
MGLTKCQKPRLWWDSNPQPLNGLTRQSRSPMRYPLRHRARRGTRRFNQLSHGAKLHARPPGRATQGIQVVQRSGHGLAARALDSFKAFADNWVGAVCKINRPLPSLTLLAWPPSERRSHAGGRERHPRHRWDLNPGSPVYETGALTN